MLLSPGKTIPLLVVLLVISGSIILAQQKSAVPGTPHISGGYAKSALLALFAIRADVSGSERRDAQTLIGTGTQDKIDAADAEARTPQELSLTRSLRLIYERKLTDNGKRKIAASDAPSLHARGIVLMEKREEACFSAIELTLRDRSPKVPQACDDMIAGPPPT
jgi:hypothetical protein